VKFQVISCDAPWSFSDGLKKMRSKVKRSAVSQYRTMSIGSIKALDVPSLVDPAGCLLALWVPGCMLQYGLDVMGAWGFTYKQNYVWVKTKKDAIADAVHRGHLNCCTSVGMGRLFRQCHELALIGTVGKLQGSLRDRSQRSVSFARNAGHSVKPDDLQDSLQRMFPGATCLEMFARRRKPGWVCIGDGIHPGVDIDTAIQALIPL
jgi:N6-adenosine-specific RNA methylase IME4